MFFHNTLHFPRPEPVHTSTSASVPTCWAEPLIAQLSPTNAKSVSSVELKWHQQVCYDVQRVHSTIWQDWRLLG